MAEDSNKGERFWILATRSIGFVIGFLPFIPNTLWYIGLNDVKSNIDTSDIFFVIVGFVFVWGSANFGKWANGLGATLVNKFKK